MFVCVFFLDSNGNTEYVETQQTTTDNYGMVNLVIGTGTPDAGYSWDNIAWTTESKSLKVDVDYGTKGNVSCDNFVGLSVQELTAVPFALYAPSVEGAPGPEGPPGPKGDKGDQEHRDQREIKVILEIKGRKVYKAPLVLLDLKDLLDPQELTQQYLGQLDHKEQQDHKVYKAPLELMVLLDQPDHKEQQDHQDQRVIKVTLEIKDRKVYKAPLELMVLLDQPDLLDPQELTQRCLDQLDHKVKQDHRDQRVIREILEIKGSKVILDPLVLLDLQDHKDQRVIKVTLGIKDRKVKQDHKVFKEYRVSKVKQDQLDLKVILEIKGHKVSWACWATRNTRATRGYWRRWSTRNSR